ncbi:MAG TPA: type II secretion system protein [Gemmatimonadaceae bacterium]|nr:type II secretion system protein [Gemmatimonadaceae bacterium]
MLTQTPRAAAQRRARTGFTLPELLIVIVIFGVIAGALVTTIARQQRFYGATEQIVTMRGNMRDAVNLLPSDLRGLSRSGGDIYAMTDSSIDFRLPAGASAICTINTGRTIVTVPPAQLASQSGVTSWLATPRAGDSLFVYDEGATTGTTDDSWRLYALTATPSAGTCPTTTGFTSTSTEAAAGVSLVLSGALPATVRLGASIRFFHKAHYSLYRAASGNWYVGFYECSAGTCPSLQAVSGPYLPYASSGGGGVRFTYFDSTGSATTNRALVSRIDVTTRAQTANPVAVTGSQREYYADSLSVSVALRNRN